MSDSQQIISQPRSFRGEKQLEGGDLHNLSDNIVILTLSQDQEKTQMGVHEAKASLYILYFLCQLCNKTLPLTLADMKRQGGFITGTKPYYGDLLDFWGFMVSPLPSPLLGYIRIITVLVNDSSPPSTLITS